MHVFRIDPSAYLIRVHGRLQYNLLMIPPDLLEILVCPVCKKSLVVQGKGESLKCTECKRVYPVRDDIPVLLADQATIEP